MARVIKWTKEYRRQFAREWAALNPETAKAKARAGMQRFRDANRGVASARALLVAIEYGMDPRDLKGAPLEGEKAMEVER